MEEPFFKLPGPNIDDLGDPAELIGDPNDPPTNHEPPGETGPVDKTSSFQKIRAAGSGLFEKWGLKRGRGRPPHCLKCGLDQKDCSCLLGPTVPPPAAPAAPVAAAADPGPRDPHVVRRSVAAIGKAARKFGDKLVYRKALEATSGDKAYAEQIRAETSASDDACDALGDAADIIMRELGLESKYLPLAASLVVVVGAATPYVLVVKSLNKTIADNRRREPIPGK